jgi:hypothetical protein
VRSIMLRMAGCGLLVLLTTACSDPSPICTAESRPGIEIEVRDRVSDQLISAVAQGVVQDGAFRTPCSSGA